MKAADLCREIAYPFTNLTVLLAILSFGSLVWLAAAAGKFGFWLGFIIVPAVFRYGTLVLESRAHGRNAEPAGIEVFNIADNLWGIFPMILLGACIGFAIWLRQQAAPAAAEAFLVIFFLVYPASVAVLVITRSPLASINPVAMYRMVRACGVAYAWIPVVLTSAALVIAAVNDTVLPHFLASYLELYVFFLLFTFTGAIVHRSGVAAEVDIDLPLEKSESERAGDLVAARRRVIDHAYGFIGRGNREGGFRHIRQAIASDPDANAAVAWYFNEMMKWESKQAALFFGQECLAHFLHHQQDGAALKVMTGCLYADPAWRPRPADRELALDLAERCGRHDLMESLGR